MTLNDTATLEDTATLDVASVPSAPRQDAVLAELRAALPENVAAHERASQWIPRGLNSRGRVRRVPTTIVSASGSHVLDVDGKDYVDCILGLGPVFLGHNHPAVTASVTEQLTRGVLYGGQSPQEAALAERLVGMIPSADKVVLSNSGSEAVAAAIRMARVKTGRRRIIKFNGGYHGWIDPMFVNSAGAPTAPLHDDEFEIVHNIPGQTVPPGDVSVTRWNDLPMLRRLMERVGDETAAVIMEPVHINGGTYHAAPGYLQAVKELCEEHGALLIFDEIISGFRLAPGGGQELVGVTPHLSTFAKALGNGFTISAIAGTDDAMAGAISGPMTHGGTYNGSVVSVAAALAVTGTILEQGDRLYEQLDERGRQLAEGMREVGARRGLPMHVNQIGSSVALHWGVGHEVGSWEDAMTSDAQMVADICERMQLRGVLLPPRGMFWLSTAHTAADVDAVVAAFDATVAEL